MTVTVLLSGEPSMVKMGRLVKDERGIAHFGCAAHRLEKTAERFYKHTGVEASLTRAKTVVTFIHKSSQVTGSGDHARTFVRALCLSCCSACPDSELLQCQDKLRAACTATDLHYKKIENDVKTRWCLCVVCACASLYCVYVLMWSAVVMHTCTHIHHTHTQVVYVHYV